MLVTSPALVRRRAVLRMAGLVGVGLAGSLAAACGGAAPTSPTAAPTTAAAPAASTASKPTSASTTAAPVSAPQPTAASAGATPTGTLTIVQGADVTSLDPQQTQGGAPRAMIAAMFDQLVTLDWEYKIVPWVASSWSVLDDRTWQFKLRNDVEFHNGEKLTAASVKWSIERFVDPKTKNIYADTLARIDHMDLIDDYTINIVTSDPYPGLIDAMAAYLFLSPPQTMQRLGDEYLKAPIGSGPYKFVEWAPGDRLVQAAADKPHCSGDPKIRQVIWKTMTEGAARVTALRTNAADIINPVAPQEVNQITSGGAQIMQAKSQGLMCLVMNASQGPLADKRVRQALNYAVDKDAIIKTLLGGIGEPINGPLTYAHEGYDATLQTPYPFDLDRARALLTEAGYPNGFQVRFDTPNGRYVQDRQIAEAIAGQWRKIGVDAQVNPLEWGNFLKEAQQKTWDLFLITQGSGGTQVLLSTCFHSGVKGIPWLGYENQQVNALIDRAGSTMDSTQRVQMYRDVVKTIRDDAPWVFLHQLYDVYGVSDRVQNWRPGSGIVLLRGTSVKG